MMTAQKFSSALCDIDERYIEEALTYTAKKKSVAWLRWGAVVACACLIVGIFAFVPLLHDRGPQSGGTVIDSILPTDIDSIIWSDAVGTDGGSGEHLEWNGFWVDRELYEVLRSCSQSQCIAVIMTKANGENIARAEYEQILDATINRHEQNGKLYLFVTVEELSLWELENKSDYALRLGDRSDYEGWGAK